MKRVNPVHVFVTGPTFRAEMHVIDQPLDIALARVGSWITSFGPRLPELQIHIRRDPEGIALEFGDGLFPSKGGVA